jgi:hypothetical protein
MTSQGGTTVSSLLGAVLFVALVSVGVSVEKASMVFDR